MKTKYKIRWISPDGNDCLLGGSNDYDEANNIAIEQAKELLNNPFESKERKSTFIKGIYIRNEETKEREELKEEAKQKLKGLIAKLSE